MNTLSTIEVENLALNGSVHERRFAELELLDRKREQEELRGYDPESRIAVLEQENERLENDAEVADDNRDDAINALEEALGHLDSGNSNQAIAVIELALKK